MRGLIRLGAVLVVVLFTFAAADAKPSPDEHDSVVIVYKNGHRQSLAQESIASIDLKSGAISFKDGHREKLASPIDRIEFGESGVTARMPGRGHYVGKWEVGEGNGNAKFFITLDADGSARKSIGAEHGTWTLVDGEARVSWDDGWKDVLRKVGSKHEKAAHEPGSSFDDPPSNVTAARNTNPRPI
jgi:hypothetical protein